MALRYALLLVLLPLAARAQEPTPDWVAVGTGVGEASVTALADDPSTYPAGVVAAGRFRGEIVFGSAAATAPDTSTAAFLAAFNADGTVRWLRAARAPGGRVVATGVASVTEGNIAAGVIVTGYTTATVRFDTGGGNNGNLYVGPGGPDGFVARYSATGELLWLASMGGPGAAWPARVAIVDGSALVVGAFSGVVVWDAGGTVTRTAVGGTDGFAARYRTNGSLERIETVGGPADDALTDVVAPLYGPTWASGTFRSRVVVAGNTLDSRGGADALAVRFGVDGAPTAAFSVGGPGDDTGDGIHSPFESSSFGVVMLAGTFAADLPVAGDTLRSRGATDLFLVEVSSDDLTPIRALQAGGPGADRLTDVASIGAFYGDVFADAYLVAASAGDGATLPAEFDPPLVFLGRGETDALAFTIAQYGGTYAGTLAGGPGTDHTFAVTGVGCFYAVCPEAAVGGSFEGSAQFGTLTVAGGAGTEAFVAHYPQSALTPFYVATAPGPDAAASLTVGPNPTRGAATAALALAAPADVTVDLYDALGRRVAVLHRGPLAGGTTRWALPAGLAPGVYVVRASGGVQASATVVVAR